MNTKELKHIEKYAEEYNIPLMNKSSIKFLTKYIEENKVKNILEIGTGIGYLAIKLALENDNLVITTIEDDSTKYIEALKNIKSFELEKRINIVSANSLDLDLPKSYDLILIDSVDKKYIDLFEKYSNNLNKNGVIITDNINYDNIMNLDIEDMDEGMKIIADKIEKNIDYLVNKLGFKTQFYKTGDGLALSKKVEE